MTEKPARQTLARGCSHTVGGRSYVGWMPLEIFNALPENIQKKLKQAVKNEKEAAEKVAESNESQREKTETDQVEVQKKKDEKKPGKG